MPQELRAGRLSITERLAILFEIGKEAQRRYNHNILTGAGNYNLRMLKNSLQFEPDPYAFENVYWIDTGNEEKNKIADYFEYGTGLFNTKSRAGAMSRGYIRPIDSNYMVWKNKSSGKMIFAKKTKGVMPVFMMTKAVKSVQFDREYLQRQIRLRLGI